MNKKDNDSIQWRLKLAKEANRRIAERKGNRHTLSQLYDEIIVASLEVFDAYDKSRPFYEHGDYVDFKTLVSFAMDNYVEGNSVLKLWSELIHTPLKDLAKCPPTDGQHKALIEVTHALENLLPEISKIASRELIYDVSNKWWTESGNRGFHWQFWQLLRLTVEVNIREIDLYFKHHETWQEIFEGGSSPICFMFGGSIKDYQTMWESIKTKFISDNPTWLLGMCDYFLSKKIADYPLAFCFTDISHYRIHRLSHIVEQALQIAHELKFEYDNKTIMWSPCNAMEMAAINIAWTVIDYFRRARAQCKAFPASHRKWLEAEAELIAHCGVEADPITAEVARHIVALANDAAKEYWIESRIKSKTDEKDAAMDRQLKGPTDHQGVFPILHKIETGVKSLNNKAISSIALNKIAIWQASGLDPKFKPNDGRVAGAIKELMIVEGLDMLSKDGALSERSVANHLVNKYQNIPGAYTDIESLRRALNRKNKLK